MSAGVLQDPERQRLLEALDLLRPHSDPAFDHVTRIAATVSGCPTALITFVGPAGQWVASSVGWQRQFHPLDEAFCPQLLGSAELIEVPDASADPRFAHNPLVTGPDHVRFYAGQPIVYGGHVLGTVCVLDAVPRRLPEGAAPVLHGLARLLADLLQVRHERARVDRERDAAVALREALERSEASVRRSEERYRLLWQTTTDVVLLVDDTSTILFANPAVRPVFGHDADALVGQPLSLLQPEHLRPLHHRGFERYLRSGQRRLNWRATETFALRADGREFPIEIAFSEMSSDGRRLFGAFIRDITDRRAAETALRHSEAQFRALTALSSDWYWELDADLRFTFLSESAAHSAALEPAECLGRTPWDVRGARGVRSWQSHREHLERRQPFRDYEFQDLGVDGTLQSLSISGEPVFENGVFAGYRGVGRNITQQRRGESARRDLEDQLREAQKLEAIGVLAGGIAHDFNNIIAGILGNAHLALDDVGAGHPACSSLQQIRKAGLRARDMVQQILTFARRQPKRPAHCDLHDLVEETLGLLRATLPSGVSLTAKLPARPLRVFADPTQMEQALINLCTNAWQALAGRPGNIVIGASEAELGADDAERLIALQHGRYICIYVQDDGPGMDEATRARVFEPFFTTKGDGEGTGLGLAVVHGIVVGHGGAITVESTPGQGSTFWLWLPADTSTAPIEAAPLLPVMPAGEGRRVLYVDDDEVMSVMVPRLLERLGYRVVALTDPEQALARLREDAAAFDVVVTDLNMPRLSGLELAREVALLRPGLPVILGSGNLPQDLVSQAEALGVRATFHKQNTLEELPAVLGRVL